MKTTNTATYSHTAFSKALLWEVAHLPKIKQDFKEQIMHRYGYTRGVRVEVIPNDIGVEELYVNGKVRGHFVPAKLGLVFHKK